MAMGLSLLLALLTVNAELRAAPSLGGVPGSRLARLERGINLSYWTRANRPASYYKGYLTPTDYKFFREHGIRHIRLAIEPALVFDRTQPARLLPGVLYVDQALRELNAAGLMVILDFHDVGQLGLDGPGADTQAFLTFWRSFAMHYAKSSPEMTMFEVLNEPRFKDNPEVWHALQRQAVEVIRKEAPEHTIVVAGDHYSNVRYLSEVQPYAAGNLVYTVHSYEPMLFTHQGAKWMDPTMRDMRSVPYPASGAAVERARGFNQARDTRQALDIYQRDGWNASSIDALMAAASDWRARNQRPVYMGECGALASAPAPDRIRYLTDFVNALRRYSIPYAPWSYEDKNGFSVLRDRRADGTVTTDPASAAALFP